MASRRGEGLAAHNVFLWPLKLAFFAWLTLALMALTAMGMEVILAKQVWGDAAGLAQAQQTLSRDLALTHDLRPDAPLRDVVWPLASEVRGTLRTTRPNNCSVSLSR